MSDALFQQPDTEGQPQDNFIETRDPSELAMCTILAAAYAGLARYCWRPLIYTGNKSLLFNIEGFFITIGLLSLTLGLRPYLNPSSLQVSGRGVKYRGPHWPQRKTVNWEQVFRLYVSPELIIILYHIKPGSKIIWPMFIQSLYLADKDKVVESVIKYSPIPAIKLKGPNWKTRLLFIVFFVLIVVFILESLVSGTG